MNKLGPILLTLVIAVACAPEEDDRRRPQFGPPGGGNATCGNGTAETGEFCDGIDTRGATCQSLGFGPGALACAPGCTDFNRSGCGAPASCGNGGIDSPERCDGGDVGTASCQSLGFTSGNLSCAPNCLEYDTSSCTGGGTCGNNQREMGETCDGADIANVTCQSLGLGAGTVTCAGDCLSFNTAGCQTACTPDCSGRQCGLDPVCGLPCGTCSGTDGCNTAGQCGPWCDSGATRCTGDGYGFEVCGVDPADSDTTSYGPRIPCSVGNACSAGGCAQGDCMDTEVTFLLDASSSMLAGGTWDWLTDSFLNSVFERQSANLFGFRQFPSSGGCNVGSVLDMDYDHLPSIASRINTPDTSSATPIEASLQGFLSNYGDPNDGQAVILMTDGDETCGTQAGAIAAASELWRAGVRVYAIAVTTTANKPFLDQLANAGGTGTAFRVTNATEFRTAFDQIFGQLNACDCNATETFCDPDADQQFSCGIDRRWSGGQSCQFGCFQASRCAQEGDVLWRAQMFDIAGGFAITPSGQFVAAGSELRFVDDTDITATQHMTYFTGAPAIGDDGTIYVGAAEGLWALNPDGSEKWTFSTTFGVNTSVAIASDGTLYAGAGSELIAVNPTGTEKWTYTAGGSIYSSPAIADDGTIYFGSIDNLLHAVDPSGVQEWTFTTSGDVNSSPAIGADGTIYVGSQDNNLYAIYPGGTERWRYLTSGDVDGSPVIGDGGTIFVGSDDNYIHAVTPMGIEAYRVSTSYDIIGAGAVGENGTLFIGSNDNQLYSIDDSGSVNWTVDLGGDGRFNVILGSDGMIYAGSDAGITAIVGTEAPAATPFSQFGASPGNGRRYETCTPFCGSNVCGDNGCGGSCGTCDMDETCNFGQCVGNCTPFCGSNVCGSDGCGGSCGTCTTGTCSAGQCVGGGGPPPGWTCQAQYYDAADGCDCDCGVVDPDCSLTNQMLYGCEAFTDPVCNAAGQCEESGGGGGCTPSCGTAMCGDDGCGGSCGTCMGTSTCLFGLCVPS